MRENSLIFILGIAAFGIISGCESTPVQSKSNQPKRTNLLANGTITSNFRVPGIDARWSNYGEYMQELIDRVQARWYSILEDSKFVPTNGSHVSVTFKLNDLGEVSILRVEETAGKAGAYACLNAIQEGQPYRKWTEQMVSDLGKEQTMTFAFYYSGKP